MGETILLWGSLTLWFQHGGEVLLVSSGFAFVFIFVSFLTYCILPQTTPPSIRSIFLLPIHPSLLMQVDISTLWFAHHGMFYVTTPKKLTQSKLGGEKGLFFLQVTSHNP